MATLVKFLTYFTGRMFQGQPCFRCNRQPDRSCSQSKWLAAVAFKQYSAYAFLAHSLVRWDVPTLITPQYSLYVNFSPTGNQSSFAAAEHVSGSVTEIRNMAFLIARRNCSNTFFVMEFAILVKIRLDAIEIIAAHKKE